MTKKKESTMPQAQPNGETTTKDVKEKVCFVIMPISDQPGYEPGHFTRVYNHIIKPAVERAGMKPHRADEENKTNDIVLDIIRKILESDHVICDLSSNNANVFYELGMRQAFDKSATLIKDGKTPRVFDVSGIRTIEYNENLRIDNIEPKIEEIKNSIIKTFKAKDPLFENSIIKQLAISAATPATPTEISTDTKLILEALQSIRNNVNQPIASSKLRSPNYTIIRDNNNKIIKMIINGEQYEIGGLLKKDDLIIGQIANFNIVTKEIILLNPSGERLKLPFYEILNDDSYYYDDGLPF